MRSLLCAAAVGCLMFCHGSSGAALGDHGRLGLRGVAYDLNGYDATGYDVLGFNLAATDRWGRSLSDPSAGLTAPANSMAEKVDPDGKANAPQRTHEKPTSTIAWGKAAATGKKEKKKEEKNDHGDKPKRQPQPKVQPVSSSSYTNIPTTTFFDSQPTPEPTAVTGGIVMFNVTGKRTEEEAAAYLKDVLNMMGLLDVVWDPLGMTYNAKADTSLISVLVYTSATTTEISRNVQNDPAAWRGLGTFNVVLVGDDNKVTSLAVACNAGWFLLANKCYECPAGQTCQDDAR